MDHLICQDKESRRKRQAERLGGLEVDNQFKLGGLLHRQVGRFGPPQDLVDIDGEVPVFIALDWPIGVAT